MANITMKELLEAGVHFGHQTKRWNPKMKEYIFGERNGIYIIDLQKTLKMFKEASKFVTDLTSTGKLVLFVGTKRQAQDAIAEEANARRHALHQQPLAGRSAHQLGHRPEVGQASPGAGRHVHRRPLRAAHQEGSHQARARAQAPVDQPRRHQEHEAPSRTPSSSSTPTTRPSPSPRPASLASRSSPSSTPTATRPWSTTSSPATTTPSAPSASSPRRSRTPPTKASRWSPRRPSPPKPPTFSPLEVSSRTSRRRWR